MSFGGAKRRRLPGQEFSWEAGSGEQDTAPTPLFPKYRVPRAKPLTPVEAEQVCLYKQLREKIHDGPCYVIMNSVGSRNASFDPFQGMATYGQRYLKKTRTLPQLAGRSYVMNLFPKELWTTLDPKYVGLSTGAGALKSRKRGFEDDELMEEEDEAKRPRRAARIDGGEEDEDGEDREGVEKGEDDLLEEDEEGEDELVDNDFEEDEDDMADDYNAEQYFDGGDDDAGDFDLGGGDDGDVF